MRRFAHVCVEEAPRHYWPKEYKHNLIEKLAVHREVERRDETENAMQLDIKCYGMAKDYSYRGIV